MGTRAEQNTVIGLVYSLFDGDGGLIEERDSSDPLFYLHGKGQLLPAVEKALDGQKIGFKTSVAVAATDAYGDYEDELVTDVERSTFPKELTLEVGMQFNTEGPDGEPLTVEVIEVSEESVTIDGNHPLAGVDLKFDLEIHSIREATQEELEHGHVHDKEGSHLH